ncbi:MAG: methyltransferase [Methylocella sp.]
MRNEDLQALLESKDDVAVLRAFLRSSQYSSRSVCEALRIQGPAHQLLTDTSFCALGHYDETLMAESDLAALGTMFFLGGWLKTDHYLRAVPSAVQSILERYACVENVSATHKRATVSLVEFGSHYFMADQMLERSPETIRLTQDAPDHVDPPNYSGLSVLVGGFILSSSSAHRFLDVGCGTGFLSILAAAEFDHVVGIDVNLRCIQFSRLNALLNNIDATFRHADCLTFEDDHPFDHITFNAPSVPRYQKDLFKVDTYASELGYDFVINAVNIRLSSLLGPSGTFKFWAVFPVRATEGSIDAILKRCLRDIQLFDVEILIEKSSPFGLSQQDIQKRRIPRGSYLMADPSHSKLYLDFVDRHSIQRIEPALITLRRNQSMMNRVSVRELASFLPKSL